MGSKLRYADKMNKAISMLIIFAVTALCPPPAAAQYFVKKKKNQNQERSIYQAPTDRTNVITHEAPPKAPETPPEAAPVPAAPAPETQTAAPPYQPAPPQRLCTREQYLEIQELSKRIDNYTAGLEKQLKETEDPTPKDPLVRRVFKNEKTQEEYNMLYMKCMSEANLYGPPPE